MQRYAKICDNMHMVVYATHSIFLTDFGTEKIFAGLFP